MTEREGEVEQGGSKIAPKNYREGGSVREGEDKQAHKDRGQRDRGRQKAGRQTDRQAESLRKIL